MAENKDAIHFPKDSDDNVVWWVDYLALIRFDNCEKVAHDLEIRWTNTQQNQLIQKIRLRHDIYTFGKI